MKKKRTILVLISCLEIIIGGILLFNFYQKIIEDRKVLGLKKVAVIDKETVVPVPDSNFKNYWEFTPNTPGQDSPGWLAEKAIYHYNADGLNERFDYPVQKENGVFRIVTLGDSFTYGHYVSTESNWPEKLEDFLNVNPRLYNFKKIEVINLGMPGFDIPYLNERYKRIGARYNPDLIIWFESGTGFARYNELVHDFSCEESEINKNFMDEIPVVDIEEQLAFYKCWENSEKEMIAAYSLEGITKMLKEHLDDFLSNVDPKKVIFFTFKEDLLSEDQKVTLNLWRESHPEVIFSSIIPDIYNNGGVLEDGHPNKKGHLTIADTIFDYLQNNIFKTE